jgi:hybrid cluster-associated redox disulfide protein
MEINKDTSVEEVLSAYPQLSKTFIELGLPCLVCGEAFWGTVAELARQHNIDVNTVLKTINNKKRELDEKL